MAVYEFPASFGQRRMWLLAQLDPVGATYNIGWRLWLDGPLRLDLLQRAWDAALDRHESLRTTFRERAGALVQVIEEEAAPHPLRVVSLEHLDEPSREAAARELLRELARASFDLETGPLVRACLLRLSPTHHVLGVVVHHIIADGWSFRVLFDEISADYEAAMNSSPVQGEPAIQYADFAMWQIEHADDGGYAESERFWRAELAGAPSITPLPNDYPFGVEQTFESGGIDLAVDATLAADLRAVAARKSSTLFAVLLASYATVLTRLTGADDLLFAVPMAARGRAEVESVVGLCMNTVIVRVRVPAEASIGQLIDEVHASTARALAHQELPVARIVELIRPERVPGRPPLVQMMFALEESWELPGRGGLRWHPELIENGTAKFELEMTVTDTAPAPRIHLNYNTALFSQATGARIADGFATVLRAVARGASLKVADVDILSARTRDLVTREWAAGPPLVEPEPEAEAEAEAERKATATALVYDACAGDRVLAEGSDGTLTGARARARAEQIAAELTRRGVGPQDRVAILLARGVRLIPALLGVWCAGAAYVPADPIYPPRRLLTMFADADVRAVIVDSGAADAPDLPSFDSPVAVVDLAELPELAEQEAPAAFRMAPQSPLATAYTMFTSGSTGHPKAVDVTQGGVAALLRATAPLLAIEEGDRFVAVSTFAFDISLVELLAPLLRGGRAIIADAETARDGAALRALLVDREATAMQATPTLWQMLVDSGGVPAGVRLRMSAGEPMPRDLADALLATPEARLWNLYGPTETTIYSAGVAVEPSPAPIELASAIAGTCLYILDERLSPAPPGVLGEVYVGGAGVAHGYAGAPAMTAERFVPDPFSPRPGARLYRTGDLGRWRDSGRVELAGRADRQVKIRGFRIECGEIEAALRNHPDVTQAVVVAHVDDSSDARLVAYVVTSSPSLTPPPGLSEQLAETLPHYMVPAMFVALADLPLTASGKVDYRALPQPQWGATPAGSKVEARTPLERDLVRLFAEVLNLSEPVGVRDSFFTLGGHSLTATRLMAQVRAEHGVDLRVRALFADPTVAGLAAAVTAAQAPPDASGATPEHVKGSAILDLLSGGDVDGLLHALTGDGK